MILDTLTGVDTAHAYNIIITNLYKLLFNPYILGADLILRKCRICGVEAKTIEELDKFIKHSNCKYNTNTICKECRKKYKKEWDKKNIEKEKIRKYNYKFVLKKRIMILYGGKCNCCGERILDFLTIDHINGGGSQERKKHKDQYNYYKNIEKQFYENKEDALKKYQILCANCNMGKYINGICPHKDKNYNKNILI